MYDQKNCDIVHSSLIHKYTPIEQVNFKSFLFTITTANNSHYKVLLHSNGICILFVAKNHILFQKRNDILQVDLIIDQIHSKGKSKKQTKKFKSSNETLCKVTCLNNLVVVLHNCIIGKLLEFNASFLKDPINFLKNDDLCSNYLAIFYLNVPRNHHGNYSEYFYKARHVNVVSESSNFDS